MSSSYVEGRCCPLAKRGYSRDDLATMARNTITTAITPDYPFTVVTRPTPIQQKAFDLLEVGCKPVATVSGGRL